MSPVLHQPNVQMLRGMRRSLKTLAVREPCTCGELCGSFSTTNPCPEDEWLLMVRFDVRGELVLGCGSDGVICYVERIFDSPNGSEKAPVERFTLAPSGWIKRELAGV